MPFVLARRHRRPLQAFAYRAFGVENLIAQAILVERCLDAMEIFDAFRHPVRRAGTHRADLQHAAMGLDIEGQNMAAAIGKDAGLYENIPEALGIFMADLALIGAGATIDRKDRVMAEHQLVAGIGMRLQRRFQPLRFNMTFAAETAAERMDEDHEQIAAANPIGQPSCPAGPFAGRPSVPRKIASLISS